MVKYTYLPTFRFLYNSHITEIFGPFVVIRKLYWKQKPAFLCLSSGEWKLQDFCSDSQPTLVVFIVQLLVQSQQKICWNIVKSGEKISLTVVFLQLLTLFQHIFFWPWTSNCTLGYKKNITTFSQNKKQNLWVCKL